VTEEEECDWRFEMKREEVEVGEFEIGKDAS